MNKQRLIHFVRNLIYFLVMAFLCNTRVNGVELGTEPADTTGEIGRVGLKAGVEYLDGRQLEFTQGPEIDRRLVRLPYMGFDIGLGERADIQADFDIIYLDEEGRENKYGVGDLRLWNKIKFINEGEYGPSMGFRWGVKLPNVYSHVNLGMGILGNPNKTNEQDDVLVYGVGGVYPVSDVINTVLEVNGYAGSNDNNNFSSLLLGFQIKMNEAVWDLGWRFGLTDESEDWGVRTGIRWMVR